MTRGDQRERDRAKARAKLEDKQKQVKVGWSWSCSWFLVLFLRALTCSCFCQVGSKLSRNLNDALALEAKVQSKRAMQEQQSNQQQGGSSVKPKPKREANPSLDALLDSGLTGSKTKAAGK
jgi:hypothetical protein